MPGMEVSITYIGGPTMLLECDGVRILTDPTFDPAGSEYDTGRYVLRKTTEPALDPIKLGSIDFFAQSRSSFRQPRPLWSNLPNPRQ